MSAFVERRWWIVLLVITILALGRMLADTLDDWDTYPPVTRDAILYQYEGWLVANGTVMYAEIWEAKPPMGAYTPALLALFTGDDMLLLHWANLALMCVAVVASVWLVGQIVYSTTGNPQAATVAGLALLTLTWFTLLGTFGFRPKYMTLMLGLAAMALAQRNRPFWSGVCLALSAGHWQPGVLFMPVAGLVMAQEHGLRHAWIPRMIAGGALATAVVMLPNVLDGSLDAVYDQVVRWNMQNHIENRSLAQTIERVVTKIRLALLVWIWGGIGMIWSLVTRKADRAWLVAGFVLFGIQVAIIDFDNTPDLFVMMAFAAIGTGLLYADISAGDLRRQARLALTVIALAAVAVAGWLIWQYVRVGHEQPGGVVVFVLAFGSLAALLHHKQWAQRGMVLALVVTLVVTVGMVGADGIIYPDREGSLLLSDPWIESSEDRLGLPSLAYMYWNRVRPSGCHFLLTASEQHYMADRGHDLDSWCR